MGKPRVFETYNYVNDEDPSATRLLTGNVREYFKVENNSSEQIAKEIQSIVEGVIKSYSNCKKSNSKITSIKISGDVNISYVRSESEQEVTTRLNKIRRTSNLSQEKSELIEKLKQYEKEIKKLKLQIKGL